MKKTVKFIPSNYLTKKDIDRIRFIKIAIIHCNYLEELKQYDLELQRLIKKAYLRSQMVD